MRLGVEAALVDGGSCPATSRSPTAGSPATGSRRANGRGIAAPGFVDLQVNGFGGVDFLDADADGYAARGRGAARDRRHGLPADVDHRARGRLVAALGRVPRIGRGPRILGVHLEGPFLSPRRLGTHPPAARRDPDPALLERLLAAGPVRLMTLAPELPGALELIDVLHARGVTVSAATPTRRPRRRTRAFDRGVAHGHAPLQRDAAVHATATPASPAPRSRGRTSIVQIILDGVHLAPDTVRSSGAPRPAGSRSSPTRSPARASAATAPTALGDVEVEVRDGVARAGPTACSPAAS